MLESIHKERRTNMEIKYCESCGNYVPTVQVDEDIYCSYEYAEYPDIATIVG
jgi:hypothetical protein